HVTGVQTCALPISQDLTCMLSLTATHGPDSGETKCPSKALPQWELSLSQNWVEPESPCACSRKHKRNNAKEKKCFIAQFFLQNTPTSFTNEKRLQKGASLGRGS